MTGLAYGIIQLVGLELKIIHTGFKFFDSHEISIMSR